MLDRLRACCAWSGVRLELVATFGFQEWSCGYTPVGGVAVWGGRSVSRSQVSRPKFLNLEGGEDGGVVSLESDQYLLKVKDINGLVRLR